MTLEKFENNIWQWEGWNVSWNKYGINKTSEISIVLIHGFGACKEHWRHNQKSLARSNSCYAIDLMGFGESSQPKAKLKNESQLEGEFCYCFDNWGNQIADFCKEVVQTPVILIGNSIGGVIALRASHLLQENCLNVVLIDCAQRTMDDKRLNEQPTWIQILRPLIKNLVSQRWLSNNLFRNAANANVIKKVLKQAYPSGKNIDPELINLLLKPSLREGASESFRGFINLFNDYLATELLIDLEIPIDLIWGEKDPWEPIEVAKQWEKDFKCIRSLAVIQGAGHCPHDEAPEVVNPLLLNIIQHAT